MAGARGWHVKMAIIRPTSVVPGPEPDPASSQLSVPATIVGGSMAWSDQSDATYSLHSPYYDPALNNVAQARGHFAPIASPAASVDGTVFIRAESLLPGWSMSAVLVDPTVTVAFGFANYGSGDVPATVGEVTLPFTFPAGADLSSGFMLIVNVFGTGTDPDPIDWARILEVWIGIDVALRLRRRPLRQFPRSDGLGMSSTRRQDANRSMQASLRRGGGVYF